MAVATNRDGEIVQITKYADSVGEWLTGNVKKLEALLPRQIRADRFIRLVVGAIRRMPKLSLCSKESLIDAMLEAAALGLELDTALGHCYVLPYRNHGQYEATFLLGYKGTVALMYRGGQVKSARAFEVFEKDIFEIDDGAEHPIVHKRCLTGDRGKLIGFASLVHTSAGGEIADYMTVEQVEAIRKRSRAGDSGPWVTDFGEMGKKTVLKRNGKYAPVSSEAARAMALDDAAENNLPQTFSMSIADVKPVRELPEPQVEPMPSEIVDADVREVAKPVSSVPAAAPRTTTLPNGSTVKVTGGPAKPAPAHVDPQPTQAPTGTMRFPASPDAPKDEAPVSFLFRVGKHKGVDAREVEVGYLRWYADAQEAAPEKWQGKRWEADTRNEIAVCRSLIAAHDARKEEPPPLTDDPADAGAEFPETETAF